MFTITRNLKVVTEQYVFIEDTTDAAQIKQVWG